MFKHLKTTALSAIIAVTALGTVPASAQSGVYLGLGGGHSGPQIGVYLGDGGKSYRRYDRRDDRRDYRRDDRRVERTCSTGQALHKAERMGLRRARVIDVSRRAIEVSGRARGDRVHVTFARVPGCPIIR